MVVKQFEVYLVLLDPTKGSEIRKTRPCVVISPDEMNNFLKTVLVIPLTSTKRAFPTRVDCIFDNKEGQVAIDQMRAVDKIRLVKKLGAFYDEEFMGDVMAVLQKMFRL